MTHVLILSGLSRHQGSLRLNLPRVPGPVLGATCWSFNGPEPGGPELTIRKREKEADIPWVTRKANRALFLGLALLHAGTGRPFEWVKAQGAFSKGS